jgi:hypothetical protein
MGPQSLSLSIIIIIIIIVCHLCNKELGYAATGNKSPTAGSGAPKPKAAPIPEPAKEPQRDTDFRGSFYYFLVAVSNSRLSSSR